MARRVSFETQSEEITGGGDVTFEDLNEHNFHTITLDSASAGTVTVATGVEASMNGNDFDITNFNKPDDVTSAVPVISTGTPGTVSVNCETMTITVVDAGTTTVTLSSYR